MKCEKCDKKLDKKVAVAFANFTVGHVKCEDGHLQKRYISELDLFVYFATSAILYALLFLVISVLFVFVGLFWYTIVVTVLIMALGLIAYNKMPELIYENAYFKKEWRNFDFKEDVVSIQKRMRWQFIMFMVLAFFMGSSNQYLPYFFVFILVFVVIVLIKLKLTINNEREEYFNPSTNDKTKES